MRDRPWDQMDMHQKLQYLQGLVPQMQHYIKWTARGCVPPPGTVKDGKELYDKLQFTRGPEVPDVPQAGPGNADAQRCAQEVLLPGMLPAGF